MNSVLLLLTQKSFGVTIFFIGPSVENCGLERWILDMKEKFMRFMSGRYGTDDFSKFLLIAAVVCMVANLFVRNGLLNTLALLLLIYVYFRMFSKNIQKRYGENAKYLELKNKFFSVFQKEKRTAEDRKTHHIYHCPNCKQKIRVPKGKGKICITCPKCKTEFTKKS